MKYFWITLLGLLAFSANAKNQNKNDLVDIQRIVLKEQLIEGHILKMDYDRKISEIVHKENIQRSVQKSQPSAMSGPGGTASISGTVRVSGVGQVDVQVSLIEIGTNEYVGGLFTDPMGSFSFIDLAAGDYYLLVNGYNDAYIDAMWSTLGTEQCTNCQPDADNFITIADAENRMGVDMDMVIGATLSGNVVSAASPIENLSITLKSVDNQGFYGSVQTDNTGSYTFYGLPADDYYLLANDASDIYIDALWTPTGTEICLNCQPDPSASITIVLADILLNYDFDMTIGATLTGRISDTVTLEGVETMQVTLFESLELFSGYFFTQFDGSGNYTIQGIPQGSYKVYLDPNGVDINEYVPEIYNNIPCNLCNTMVYNGAGDLVDLTNGMTTSGIDFTLNKGASVSGVLLNAANLTETIQEFALVYVFNVTNRLIASQIIYGTNYEPTFDGTFRIGGLLPGTYFVQGGDVGREFYQRELYNDVRCPWSGCDRGGGGSPISLGSTENRFGINFHLEYGGKISGTITDAVSGLPINGGFSEYVQFYDSMGRVAGGAAIRDDGTYTAQRAIPPGTYSVRSGSMFTGDFISPYVMQKYAPSGNIDCPGITCDLASGNVTVTALTTTTNIDFALSPAFSFSGTITELGSSDPIPDVHVLVYDDNANFATWATTDAVGDFTVSGLPAGTYYALTNNGSNLPLMGYFPEEVGGWIDILFDGTPCPGSACDVTTGTPIVLGSARGAQVLDFGLSAGGTITGQVNIFGSQLPASFVNINVYNDQGVFFGSYPSDNNGSYLTVGLPAGTYYLTTSNDGALVNVKYGNDYCTDNCNPLDAVPLVITGEQSLIDVDFDLRMDYVFKNGLE